MRHIRGAGCDSLAEAMSKLSARAAAFTLSERYPQQAVFVAGGAEAELQPHPAAPVDFASASRTQQAFVPWGAGPRQHAFAGAASRLSVNCRGPVNFVLVASAIIALLVSSGDCTRRSGEKTSATDEGRKESMRNHAAWSSAA